MAISKKPGISETRVSDRSAALQVSNIRQRIEAIEAAVDLVQSQANQTSFSAAKSNASLASILSELNELRIELDALNNLMQQDDGIVVLHGDDLITRTLEAGLGISITFPDGASGNPLIASTGSVYPFITTEDDDDLLTESGHRIRIED